MLFGTLQASPAGPDAWRWTIDGKFAAEILAASSAYWSYSWRVNNVSRGAAAFATRDKAKLALEDSILEELRKASGVAKSLTEVVGLNPPRKKST